MGDVVSNAFSLVRCEDTSDPSAPVVERLRAKPSAVIPEGGEGGREGRRELRVVSYPFSLICCEETSDPSDPSAPVVERLRAKPSAVMPEGREGGRKEGVTLHEVFLSLRICYTSKASPIQATNKGKLLMGERRMEEKRAHRLTYLTHSQSDPPRLEGTRNSRPKTRGGSPTTSAT